MADPTNLVYQQIKKSGTEVTYDAADSDNGNQFQNDGRMFVHVKNETGDPATITFDTPHQVDGLAIANRAVVVADGEERMIGPFPPSIYNDGGRLVQISYTVDDAGVTLALLRL
jgi:hypothetical protein